MIRAARLTAFDPGFPARRSCENDVGQAHTGAGGRPSAASYCPESNASEVAAGRGQTYWVGTNDIQKDLGERD